MVKTVCLTYLGTNSLLISDGTTHLMIDPHFSRPAWQAGVPLPFIRIAPDETAIDYALNRVDIHDLDAVLLTHTHYDHALDAPTVALQCGASLVGSQSAVNLGRGAGMAENHLVKILPGQNVDLGSFIATFIESRHLPFPKWLSRRAGLGQAIEQPLAPPARMDAYKSGEIYAIHLEHNLGRLLIMGSAGFIKDSLKNHPADGVVLGIGGLDYQRESYCSEFFKESVLIPGARRVFISHWDNFTRPINSEPKIMPLCRHSLKAAQNLASELKNPLFSVTTLRQWEKLDVFSER